VELRLDQLGASGQNVREITALNEGGKAEPPVAFHQDGGTVRFATFDKVFAYRISLDSPARAGR